MEAPHNEALEVLKETFGDRIRLHPVREGERELEDHLTFGRAAHGRGDVGLRDGQPRGMALPLPLPLPHGERHNPGGLLRELTIVLPRT
jgi:hypothetical protein